MQAKYVKNYIKIFILLTFVCGATHTTLIAQIKSPNQKADLSKNMSELDKADAKAVLKAIEDDWSLVDESPETDYLIGVNEDRDELEGFRPKKEFVALMEKQGLIENTNEENSLSRTTSTYQRKEGDGDWQEVTVLDPIVYFYKITKKGRNFLKEK